MNVFKLKKLTVQKSNPLIFPKGEYKQMAPWPGLQMVFLPRICILQPEQLLPWRLRKKEWAQAWAAAKNPTEGGVFLGPKVPRRQPKASPWSSQGPLAATLWVGYISPPQGTAMSRTPLSTQDKCDLQCKAPVGSSEPESTCTASCAREATAGDRGEGCWASTPDTSPDRGMGPPLQGNPRPLDSSPEHAPPGPSPGPAHPAKLKEDIGIWSPFCRVSSVSVPSVKVGSPAPRATRAPPPNCTSATAGP